MAKKKNEALRRFANEAGMCLVVLVIIATAITVPVVLDTSSSSSSNPVGHSSSSSAPPSSSSSSSSSSTGLAAPYTPAAYTTNPTPQLSPTGSPSGVPTAFAINTSGLSVPRGWGTNYSAAQAAALLGAGNPPLEVALIGDANVWNGYWASELITRLQGDYGVGGTGFRPLNYPGLCNQTLPTNASSNGPSGTSFTMSAGVPLRCVHFVGDTMSVLYQACSGCGAVDIVLDGSLDVYGGPTSTAAGSTSVQAFTFTTPAVEGVPDHYVTLTANATVYVYGIKSWWASKGGALVNVYSATGGINTNNPLYSMENYTCTIAEWGGGLWVDGHMVVTFFQLGDQDAYTPVSAYVDSVKALVVDLRVSSRDVLFMRPLYDGHLWNMYRPALWADPTLSATVAMLDVATWWDFSLSLFKAHGGYLPCNSSHLPANGDYCWNEGDLIALSNVGATLYWDVLYPLLNGTGYYANTATWPRQDPSLPWPVPIPQAALTRPSVPMGLSKKAVGLEPEGDHPILYNCSMISALNVSAYFNWDVVEPCASTQANVTGFPMYIGTVWSELTIAFQSVLSSLPNATRSPILKTFNEPNVLWEAHTTPTRAAMLWPLLEATGRVLAGPACSQIGENEFDGPNQSNAYWSAYNWTTEWQNQCWIVLGRACVYDLGDFHYYDADPTAGTASAAQLYAITGKPTILSEFGVGTVSYITGGSLAVIDTDPTIYMYMWFALRCFCNGDSYGSGLGGNTLYPCINEADCLLYLAGTGNASALSQPLNTLSLTPLGIAYQAFHAS